MRAVDTNVLVRLITRDDKKQVESAEELVSKGAWVSHLVLAETSWVFDSVYDRTRDDIAKAVEMLLNHEHLTLQDQDVVATAAEKFRLPFAGKRGRASAGPAKREGAVR